MWCANYSVELFAATVDVESCLSRLKIFWFHISILGTEVFLLAVLMSICDMCLSVDKLFLYDKQIAMCSLQM